MVSLVQFSCFSTQTHSVSCALCAISPLLRSLAYLLNCSKPAKLFPDSGPLHRLVPLFGMPFFFSF